ncbi:MAG: CvpA family protein [Gammaproteobacteria bacterium]|jgi:membrane protein required for colicin V production|nr:MAG: CvpA family protein [Gammaproteobacteria bacterium]HDN69572.1 CvpA family protein [Gammaproteobacteria bacterium]
MAFAWIDVVILALIALSAILSLFRGFVREAVALATWLVALWVAMAFHEDLAAILSQWISTPSAQKITAFAVLFICVLLLGAIINFLASKLVDKTGLTGTDRLLGIVFGVARGGVIVAILVLLAGLTPFPQDPWWQDSQFIGYFEELAMWMRSYLPDDIADNITYA